MSVTTRISVGISGADSLSYSAYDDAGDLTQRVDGRGVTTSYTYSDPWNLLTNVSYTLPTSPPAGLVNTPNVSVSYDDFGRVGTANNGITSETYTYDDDDDQLSKATLFYQPGGTSTQFTSNMSYTYYADGSRDTMVSPSGTSTYTFDAGQRLTGLSNPFSESTAWGYQNNNWLGSQTLANGAVTSYSYNDRGQMTELANKTSGGSTISDFSGMTYDAVSNMAGMTVSAPGSSALSGSTSYGYDNRNELTSESSTRNSGYSNSFAYDAGQNPTTFRGATMPTANSDNQMFSTTIGADAVDGDGNPTSYNTPAQFTTQSLTFDPENRMTACGSVETNGYGVNDLRAWSTTSAGTTYFLYDGDEAICELNGSGTVTATNTIGANGLVSRNSSSASTFYAFDAQGSTAERLDSSEDVLSNTVTDAFGAASGTVSTDPFSGYNSEWGYYNDSATGLQLLGHRFYDQTQGRFINRDPIGYDGGLNLYGYTGNGPVAWEDEDGTTSIGIGVGEVGGGIIGGIIGGALAGGEIGVVGGSVVPGVGNAIGGIGGLIGGAIIGGLIGGGMTGGFGGGGILPATDPGIDGPPDGYLPVPGHYVPTRGGVPISLPNNGQPGVRLRDPDAGEAPHSQLGYRRSKNSPDYPVQRTWGPGSGSIPESERDCTDHGLPQIPGHNNPHEHPFDPKTGARLKPE